MKLNLGCGLKHIPGYVNLDYDELDLNVFPYPFSDGSIDIILLNHVLEHLFDRHSVIKECHRILKHGGVLRVVLPVENHNIFHISNKHTANYFNGVSGRGDDNSVESCDLFDLSVKGINRGFSKWLWKTWNNIHNWFFTDWEYVLTKKEVD